MTDSESAVHTLRQRGVTLDMKARPLGRLWQKNRGRGRPQRNPQYTCPYCNGQIFHSEGPLRGRVAQDVIGWAVWKVETPCYWCECILHFDLDGCTPRIVAVELDWMLEGDDWMEKGNQ